MAAPGNRVSRAEAPLLGRSEINELTISLRLADLRRMDGDERLQREFIQAKLGGIDQHRINVVVLRLRVAPGQKIENMDVEYIWDLLQAPGNDIVVPPVVNLPGGSGRLTRYQDFLKMFLVQASSAGSIVIGATLPSFTHHSRVRDILSPQLAAGAEFILHDLGGRIALSNYPIITAVLRILRENSMEDFFLYGYDPKPYKQATGTVAASDLTLWTMGFNSFGPRHTIARMPRNVIPKPPRGGVAAGWSRVLVQGDYGYHRLDQTAGKRAFESWMSGQRDRSTPISSVVLKDEDLTKVWTRAYNRGVLGGIGSQFEKRIHAQTLAKLLRTKQHAPELLRLALKANHALYQS